jgi:hypothetical protein
MKTRLVMMVVSVVFGIGNSCFAITHSLSGVMDPFQATTNPSNVGNGTGNIQGDYDDVTNTLNYSIDWANLTSSVTNMHFHIGAPGVPGGVALGIPGPWTSPEVGSGIILNSTQESDLLAGNWYVNVHTSNFSGGEIRGQVLVAAIPEPTTASLATVVFVSVLSLGRRRKRAE